MFHKARKFGTMVAFTAALASIPHQAQAQQRAEAKITAYCLQGPTYTGEWVRPGAVAVDPNYIPLHSSLTIDGLPGVYTALDTGSGVRGYHVDLWMDSCYDAFQWGVQLRGVEWW